MFEVIEGGGHSATREHDRDRMGEADRVLHPAAHLANPTQVVEDISLSLTEKRAILSSWASDACAVEAVPALRKVPGATVPVPFDEIMDALQLLDREWTSRALGKRSKAPGSQAGGDSVYFG